MCQISFESPKSILLVFSFFFFICFGFLSESRFCFVCFLSFRCFGEKVWAGGTFRQGARVEDRRNGVGVFGGGCVGPSPFVLSFKGVLGNGALTIFPSERLLQGN